MMRRHNKREIEGFAVPVPFIAVAVGVCSLVLGLGYDWLDCRYKEVCAEVRDLESEDRELGKLLENEQHRWAVLKSPASMDEALARHGIVLVWPRGKQVVRMDGPRLDEPATQDRTAAREEIRGSARRDRVIASRTASGSVRGGLARSL